MHGLVERILLFPTWYLVNAVAPFLPKGHPWRGRWFTMEEWDHGATELTRGFSLALWLWLLAAILVTLAFKGYIA